ncbi:XRE family transcriptional regulator [Macrococcoides bohemicum]|uniref:helix-turn-helix domain-containing protein n=1 Tax=Macrococcoides bohemicum TaxID=1903056 RepID=UPI00105943F1|nr:helix-turn-helix transcriptional regulator [Macrococcus bohemicus]TDL33497.1 XRE family transcriptional regulator [Macrococcus bohemicus]
MNSELKLAELMRTIRKRNNNSLSEVSNFMNISDVYLSKIENNKRTPSLKVFYSFVLFTEIENTPNEDIENLFSYYSVIKKINIDKLKSDYSNWKEDYFKNRDELFEAFDKNKIKAFYNEDGLISREITDEPYFDLNWLLTQKKYILFHSGFITSDNEMNIFKNALTKKDIKMIDEIIRSALKRNYEEMSQDMED